jgi:hypothetical protein
MRTPSIVCGRCGQLEDRDHPVRMALVNTSKESREDGGPVYASLYEHGFRCVDKDACRARARQQREATR